MRAVTRLLIVPALFAGFLALGSPQRAVAQSPDATPSARELWETYPLDATPEPGAGTPAATASAAPARPQPAESSRTGVSTIVAGALALLAFGVGFALMVGSLARRPRSRSPERAASPHPTPAGNGTWRAEIEWHAAAGEGRFRAVAHAAEGRETAVLAESPPVAWPPSGEAGVPTLTEAANELERRLIAAGWRPLPRGEAWYAKRFVWEPVVRTRPRRFGRRPTGEKVT